jgi:hypothetical protein
LKSKIKFIFIQKHAYTTRDISSSSAIALTHSVENSPVSV